MDRRLLLEFMPGVVFLLVNFLSSLYVATAAATATAALAVVLRYRMDRQVPFIALATVALSVTLLVIGIVLDDESYIKIRPTIGGVAFATIIAIGFAFRPSLLQRSLGYKMMLTPTGWTILHLGWISLALSLAMLNELVWRNTSTDLWATYYAASGPVSFCLYWLVTWCVAWNYWIEDE